MFLELANHNADLKRLLEKGYAITEDHGYLVVRDIPYLDSSGDCQTGAIVALISDIDGKRVRPHDHQIFFAGAHPCHMDGTVISGLGGGPANLALPSSPDVVVQRSFSNKIEVKGGGMRDYNDFFEKIEHYVRMISGPAMEKCGATPYTFRLVEEIPTTSIFKFRDTLTSRAQIVDLSSKFAEEVVAVIGLGGTGSYVLDFLVKTPVKEIRGFDFDDFHVHTAYRSPGRLIPDVELGKKKADVYKSRYENFRDGLRLEPRYIKAESTDSLAGVTFAFVCVDKGTSRAGIFDLLISHGIPFIDVGMGLNRTQGPIDGSLRATYYSAEDGQRLRDLNLAELVDDPADEYRIHVQTAELNALNAAMAVIKFKQIRGFYFDKDELNSLVVRVGNIKTLHETL
jgi:molybdopterin/thiamine biosynthesis adenylyltransferase